MRDWTEYRAVADVAGERFESDGRVRLDEAVGEAAWLAGLPGAEDVRVESRNVYSTEWRAR